jgi:hypothetical protein
MKMKKCYRLILTFICTCALSQGFSATFIPDLNFRNWLAGNYPSAMSGAYLDETHPNVVNAYALDVSYQNIADLTGIFAFQNVVILDVRHNQLTGSFYAPSYVEFLFCSHNQLTYVEVPYLAKEVWVDHNQISGVFDMGFGSDLYLLDCSHNQITALTGGSGGSPIATIDASHNQITQLPGVNWNNPPLSYDFSYNLITEVTEFGPQILDLSHNLIDSIGTLFDLSSNSSQVNLTGNPLSKGVGRLNSELTTLEVDSTQMPCLPRLPLGMTNLYCRGANVSCLPNVPVTLNTDPTRFDFVPIECASGDPCYSPDPRVKVGLYLDGPFDPVSNTMHDSLRVRGLIPTTEPYTALGYAYVGSGAAGASIPASMLNTAGNDAIVDWVIIELLDGNSSLSNTIWSLPALVQRDGDVVGMNGSDTIEFVGAEWGYYYVAVRHRNHLGLIPLDDDLLRGDVETVDFRNNSLTGCFPNAAIIDWTDFTQRMWCGDVVWDKVVKYTGNSNDRDQVLVTVGGSVPTNVIDGVYSQADVNLDGRVKYTGMANDRDRILQTIGGTVPTATRLQVPQF